MKYLIGSKQEFLDFLDSIKPEDKVGILTHIDLDGFASAILIEEVLKTKDKDVEFIDFLHYKKGMFDNLFQKLRDNKITKLFVTDICADGNDLEGFEKLRKEFDVFLIDHHQVSPDLKNTKNIIKTETADCCTWVIYGLVKHLIEGDWNKVLCTTMISEISYKNPENLKFIQSLYPDVVLEEINNSEPGKLSKKISGALIYMQKETDGIRKVYNLIKENNFDELGKYEKVMEEVIDKTIAKYEAEAEFYPEKNLYYLYLELEYNVSSVTSTILSFKHLGKTIIIVSSIDDEPDYVKVSAKNNAEDGEDMAKLLKKGIDGLENASAGGHRPAAGARFMKKDLSKFKENLLR